MVAVNLRISLGLWDTGLDVPDIGSSKTSGSSSMLRPGKVWADWALEIRDGSARGGSPLSGAIGDCHCAGKGRLKWVEGRAMCSVQLEANKDNEKTKK